MITMNLATDNTTVALLPAILGWDITDAEHRGFVIGLAWLNYSFDIAYIVEN
jgi:hypothetical protein